MITLADDVPLDCLVDTCERDFHQVEDTRERLAQIKQHLYQEHLDELSQDEIVELAEQLPGLDDM